MMKRALFICFVLAFVIGFIPSTTQAEEVEFTVTSYLTKAEWVVVPDVEKHGVGLYERRGIAVFRDGKTAVYHSRGTYDFTNRNGPFQGYTNMTYEDGSTTIAKYTGKMTMETGKMPKFKGNGEYIKGTGKYEGIKGKIEFHGGYITPFNKETKGDTILYVKSNYTLP